MSVKFDVYSKDRKRQAIVEKRSTGYFVKFFENSQLREERDLTQHSIYYAEDAAINWINYIIK
jgi:hypothetical protein